MSLERSKTRWVLTLTGVCLVMGALLAVQVRSRTPEQHILASRFGVVGGGPIGAISQVLAATQKKSEEQAQEIADLRKQVSNYTEVIAKEKDIAKPLAEQLASFQVALGLTAVAGPGVILTVDDSTLRLEDKSSQEALFLVHDFDLLQISNELWAAGAEAISINGQRLVGGTAIRCVGPTTQVNGVPVSAPYHFIALGDASTLASALNLPGGVLDRLRPLKFRILLEEKARLVAPAISIARKFRLSHPVEAAEARKPPS